MPQEVERYPRLVRVMHWVNAVSFGVLFLTGLVLFLPQLAFLAEDSWTRILHRVAAVVFIAVPVLHLLLDWQGSVRGIKMAFSWGEADLGWLRAAPRYYFLSDEAAMPAQPHMNSGQKLWWMLTIVGGVIFIATGIVLWALSGTGPPALMQWMVLLHDVAFIVTGVMLFVHVYLSAFHPLMRRAGGGGAWDSMMGHGKVSAEYAESHHGEWYQTLLKPHVEAEAQAEPQAQEAGD
jgi:formate dehydrogenase subunit gamma